MDVATEAKPKKKINSRAKGAAAERELIGELAEWLGDWVKEQVKRNLEQTRNGGHDLVGLGKWAVEVKRYAEAGEADIARWWEQASSQAELVGKVPALAYRLDRRSWRVRIPMNVVMEGFGDASIDWTVELSLRAFCGVVRESIDVQVS